MSDETNDRLVANYEDELEKQIQIKTHQQEDFATQKLFLAFQNAAKEVTKMFRNNNSPSTNWNSFNTAAQAVTMLYKGETN